MPKFGLEINIGKIKNRIPKPKSERINFHLFLRKKNEESPAIPYNFTKKPIKIEIADWVSFLS